MAVKVIDKSKLYEEREIIQLNREVKILQSLDHPNIAKHIESYNDRKKMFICMELCQQSLGEMMETRGKL